MPICRALVKYVMLNPHNNKKNYRGIKKEKKLNHYHWLKKKGILRSSTIVARRIYYLIVYLHKCLTKENSFNGK